MGLVGYMSLSWKKGLAIATAAFSLHFGCDSSEGKKADHGVDIAPVTPVCKMLYFDQDQDNYGIKEDYVEVCSLEKLAEFETRDYVDQAGDCDDANKSINPLMDEINAERGCDYVDNDCDGLTDVDYPIPIFCPDGSSYKKVCRKSEENGERSWIDQGSCLPSCLEELVVSKVGDQELTEKETLTFILPFKAGDGRVIEWYVDHLPKGAVFKNRIFTWTPSCEQAGEYKLTIVGMNESCVVTETIDLTVNDLPDCCETVGVSNITYCPAETNVVFVVDTTGSMKELFSSSIDSKMDHAKKIITNFTEQVNAYGLNLGLVTFKDHVDQFMDEKNEEKVINWAENISEFQQLVSNLKADQGGDYPEGQLCALAAAAKEDTWFPGQRHLVLVTDDEFHKEDGICQYSIEEVNSLLTERDFTLWVAAYKANTDIEKLTNADDGGWLLTPDDADHLADYFEDYFKKKVELEEVCTEDYVWEREQFDCDEWDTEIDLKE